MQLTHPNEPKPILRELLGARTPTSLLDSVQVPVELSFTGADSLSRAEAAMALGLVLVQDLLTD